MPNIIEIGSLSHPGAEVYCDLRGASPLTGQNRLAGLFIAESVNVIAAALDAGHEPVSLLMERRNIESASKVIARCGDIPVFTGDDAVLEGITGFNLSRGVLCAMRRKTQPQVTEALAGKKLAAVLWGIVDPTNVGAIFRSAAALGAEAVLLDKTCCDPLHRRASRVSMGAVFRVPWARLSRDDLSELREAGFASAAMALRENAIGLSSPALKNEKKLALVLGSEGPGLPDSIIDECDHTVMIRMLNGVDSLNVGAAAAVAFWELGSCREQKLCSD